MEVGKLVIFMTPLLTIQMLGLVYQRKLKAAGTEAPVVIDDEIVDLIKYLEKIQINIKVNMEVDL